MTDEPLGLTLTPYHKFNTLRQFLKELECFKRFYGIFTKCDHPINNRNAFQNHILRNNKDQFRDRTDKMPCISIVYLIINEDWANWENINEDYSNNENNNKIFGKLRNLTETNNIYSQSFVAHVLKNRNPSNYAIFQIKDGINHDEHFFSQIEKVDHKNKPGPGTMRRKLREYSKRNN